MARISTEAIRFNIAVQPAIVSAGQPVYRIKDIFTTRDGSWEPSSVPGSIPQWARDTYLKPFSSPDYFDDAGADHHILGGVYDEATGRMNKSATIHYWTYTDNANHVRVKVKDKSGWANIVMFNFYNPADGNRGPWAWCPETNGIPADIVSGAGMPNNWHVSFFATWVLAQGDGPVVPPVEPPTQDPRIVKLETWARAISAKYPQGPQYV